MKKTKVIRVDEDLVKMADKLGEEFFISGSRFYSVIFMQGLKSIEKNGIQPVKTEPKTIKTDKELLKSEGDKLAKIGSYELNRWLDSLTTQEEYAVRYLIKDWRKKAK